MNFDKLIDFKSSKGIAIVGVPSDSNSSYLKGTAQAPPKIIEAFYNDSTNLTTEGGLDLSLSNMILNIGNMNLTDDQNVVFQIENIMNEILENNVKVISLGGDHSVSYPLIKATSKFHKKFTILHFDAHPDLYHEFEGNKYSHACPFARVMEENLAVRMVSIGIRAANNHQREQAEKFKVETIEMKDWTNNLKLEFNTPVYISLDLDVLDPAYAPGISHYEPGGCTVRDVIRIIQNIDAPIIGADIVELNPDRDYNDITAMTAAKFLKEIAGKMLVEN